MALPGLAVLARYVKQHSAAGHSNAAGKAVHFSYDSASQFQSITRYSGTTVATRDYSFDSTGNLVGLTYTDQNPAGNKTLAAYQWTYDADDRVTQEESSADALSISNGPGVVNYSVRDLVIYSSGTTTVLNHRVFSAYRQLLSQTNPSVVPPTPATVDCLFAYTGRPLDQKTGLQNNLNRWYDATVGKWLSEDPLGLGPDPNPYRYCGNGPTDGSDPSGLAAAPAPAASAPVPYVGPQTSKTGLTIAQLMDLVNGPNAPVDSKALLANAVTECGKVTPWFEPAYAGTENAAAETVGAYTTLNEKKVWIAKGSILLSPTVNLSQAMDALIFELANLSQAKKVAALQLQVKTQGMSEYDYQVQSLLIETETNEIAMRILKKNAVKWGITATRETCPGYADAVKNGTQVTWAKKRYETVKKSDAAHVQNTKNSWQQLIDTYNQTHPSAPYGR